MTPSHLTIGSSALKGLLAESQSGQVVLARLEVLRVDGRRALDGHVALYSKEIF